MLNTSSTTNDENWMKIIGIKREKIPVLIIGNNPIEMTTIYNLLIGIRSKDYIADVCFNVKDSFERITKTKPAVFLIDDNLELDDINKLVRILKHNPKTKHIKTIALKSSNWNYRVIYHVDDYILKETIKANVLDRLIKKNLNASIHQLA